MSATRLYLIDGQSYIYRAYFAIRQYLSTAAGLPTNAVLGFTNMLLKILRGEKPDLLAIVFDPKGPTRRHEVFESYKAQRPSMPADLSRQIPYIHRMVDALRIPRLQVEGQEADDVLGTLAVRGVQEGFQVTLVTGDKDMLQLVGPNVIVLDTMKGKVFTEKEVIERFGVEPGRVVEVMGLMGDSIDNIPGVPGIGEKTAVKLIREFGTLENVLANPDQVKGEKLRQSLKEHAEQARLSHVLCTVQTDLPIDFPLESLRVQPPDRPALLSLLRDLEFSNLLREFSTEPAPTAQVSLQVEEEQVSWPSLKQALKSAAGFAFEMINGPGATLQFTVAVSGDSSHVLGEEITSDPAIRKDFTALLEDPDLPKICHDAKGKYRALAKQNIHLRGVTFDPMIAAYLLNPAKSRYDLPNLALESLGISLTEEGKGQISALEARHRAAVVFKLREAQLEPLRENGLNELFYEVDLPLARVLARMEDRGIKVNLDHLRELSKRIEIDLEQCVSRIYALAGTKFNINSPAQLREILFERLGLKPIKRTKTGFSTDMAVLEKLAEHHDLPAEILSYRQLAKLKSTYIDALPTMVDPQTGRIHTSYNQTVAATGRLSSSDPNLQNIPIRTELGREIRKAFAAEQGSLLLSADYSQIELRILAHFAGDEVMQEAFQRGEDIHARTAAEIFGVDSLGVTPEMRRVAKTVNFGIVYGQTAYGLASGLNLSREEARAFIERYFQRYPGVKAYIEKMKIEATQQGYVTTLMNRRRYLPELESRDRNVRELGERLAINSPIQGSAADIIKKAMVRIDGELEARNFRTAMILQVHDELVFEVPEEEVDPVSSLVKRGMEEVVSLSVPLVVDIHSGKNWNEAH
ncbi:MAG TPA: DNA polymerase I [bacterium]|nr:DNA polymerase I [bacterium]